jgi:hypothetical protein
MRHPCRTLRTSGSFHVLVTLSISCWLLCTVLYSSSLAFLQYGWSLHTWYFHMCLSVCLSSASILVFFPLCMYCIADTVLHLRSYLSAIVGVFFYFYSSVLCLSVCLCLMRLWHSFFPSNVIPSSVLYRISTCIYLVWFSIWKNNCKPSRLLLSNQEWKVGFSLI